VTPSLETPEPAAPDINMTDPDANPGKTNGVGGPPVTRTVKVKEGGTLSGSVGISDPDKLDRIAQYNGLRSRHEVRAGQSIVIPSDEVLTGIDVSDSVSRRGSAGAAYYAKRQADAAQAAENANEMTRLINRSRTQLSENDNGSGSDYGLMRRGVASAPSADYFSPTTVPYDEYGLFTMPGSAPIWDAIVAPVANVVGNMGLNLEAARDNPEAAAWGAAKRVVNFGPDLWNAAVDLGALISPTNQVMRALEISGNLPAGTTDSYRDALKITPLVTIEGRAEAGGSIFFDAAMLGGPAAYGKAAQLTSELVTATRSAMAMESGTIGAMPGYVARNEAVLGNVDAAATKAPAGLDWSRTSPRTGGDAAHHVMQNHGSLSLTKPNQGVFYGDPIAATEGAWATAQRVGTQPVTVGNRDIYIVGRPNSGYSGGYSGQLDNLDYITLITETGSNRVVTAFPSGGTPPIPKGYQWISGN
jgi:hypothetical protein